MKKLAIAAVWLMPVLALAQPGLNTGPLQRTIENLTNTVNSIVPLMLAVAVVFFIYGVIKYIIAKDEIKRGDAVNRIVWSVVGLASILAVWGLANLLISLFGIENTQLRRDRLPIVPPR